MKTPGAREMTILLQRLYPTEAASSIKRSIPLAGEINFLVYMVAAIWGSQYKRDSPSPSFFTLPDNGIVQQKFRFQMIPDKERKFTMILGMSLHTYTTIHVAISLIGIAAGFIVLFGLLAGKLLSPWNGLFLLTTVLTSVTGFFFPNSKITPGIVIGVLSMIVLAVALFALYARHLSGGWRRTYVITAMVALYFNVFVLVAQLFAKVPALHALAPTQSEAPFKIVQLLVLVFFAILIPAAAKKYRLAV
jgi:hypothetical protein